MSTSGKFPQDVNMGNKMCTGKRMACSNSKKSRTSPEDNRARGNSTSCPELGEEEEEKRREEKRREENRTKCVNHATCYCVCCSYDGRGT